MSAVWLTSVCVVITAVKLSDGSNPVRACNGQAHIQLPEQQVQSRL